MRKKSVNQANAIKNKPSTAPEIDYSPKKYTLREQILFGVKMFVVMGIFWLIIWLIEK